MPMCGACGDASLTIAAWGPWGVVVPQEHGVVLYGGPRACDNEQLTAAVPQLSPAASLNEEYGSLACCVEIVDGVEAAIRHIHAHGSGHTEAVVATDEGVIRRFLAAVDAACVFANASTRFADGYVAPLLCP